MDYQLISLLIFSRKKEKDRRVNSTVYADSCCTTQNSVYHGGRSLVVERLSLENNDYRVDE
jgi:hypothetical protein